MSRERPINADVPAPEATDNGEEQPAVAAEPSNPTDPATEKPPAPLAGPSPTPPSPPASSPPSTAPGPRRRRRRPIPGAVKGIAALVLLAIVFIVAAVVGGSGGKHAPEGPAPVAAGGGGSHASASQSPTELGYPGFATNNTTRIGGSDAAANAAGAALAVFPSTTAAQRPAAVVLVGEDQWQAALAASVLMAPPVRAPLLISAAGGMPEATDEALSALDPAGAPATGGAAVFAIGDVATPGGKQEKQIVAGAPAATAAAIAQLRDRLFKSAPAHVIVAPVADPSFAMPAAAWAARSGDPVLFSDRNRLPKATVAALRRHPKVPVYVLGPDSAISSAVVAEIAKIGENVHRVGAKDPAANAVAFARYGDGSFGWDVNDPGHGFVLARADSPLDAAAAAPLSASGTWGPLLLTEGAATLPAAVREYFLDVKPGYTNDPTRAFYNHVWVIGDQEAIDVNQQAEVNELAELAKIGSEEP